MRIPTLILFVAALCLPIGVAQAQMVYKCVGKAGAVSFQSDPCPATHKTAKTVYAPPEPNRPRAASAYAPSNRPQSQVNNYVYNSTTTESERDRRRRECDFAKRNRQATLDRVGLQRTHDLLRSLDGAVYEACKGL